MRVAPAAPYSFWQRLVACAARPCGAAATMTEAHLVAHKRLTGAEVVPVWQHVRGWAIHFPAVVGTSSPSTTTGPRRARRRP